MIRKEKKEKPSTLTDRLSIEIVSNLTCNHVDIPPPQVPLHGPLPASRTPQDSKADAQRLSPTQTLSRRHPEERSDIPDPSAGHPTVSLSLADAHPFES